MRRYVVIGSILLLAIWDFAQNDGRLVRAVGGWIAGLMQAIGLL